MIKRYEIPRTEIQDIKVVEEGNTYDEFANQQNDFTTISGYDPKIGLLPLIYFTFS